VNDVTNLINTNQLLFCLSVYQAQASQPLLIQLRKSCTILGYRTYVLDGDNIRHGLSSNLTFSNDDRKENIRRIGEAAKLMMEAGVITMTAFISPFKGDRNTVRQLLPHGDFIEIYCNASLEVCESRNVKGLYKLARAGEIKNYTSINSPYEAPDIPELIIDTENESLEESVDKVVDFLKFKEIIN